MCSGCSGDYAGDFEDPDEVPDDSGGGRRAWGRGEPEADEDRLRTQGASSFEARPNAELDSQLASSPGSKDESAGEIYEIMVSATRIVEIRIIRANSGEIKEFRDAKAAEVPAGHKHSQASSAKYYRTRGGCTEGASDGVEMSCCRQVAVTAAGQFKRWGRWARKAMAKLRPKNR